jgi:hypothetical protein
MSQPHPPELLTLTQACAVLERSGSWVSAAVAAGRLPVAAVVGVMKSRAFRRTDVLRLRRELDARPFIRTGQGRRPAAEPVAS